MYRSVLLVCFGLIATGCASWQATIEAWNGRKLDELIMSWGLPEKIYEFSDGRKCVLYTHPRMIQAT